MRFHWLFQLSTWIEQTALSQFIQNTSWIVPAVQTVHILAIAAVLSSATMVACRFAGWGGSDQPPRQFVARYLPSIADNMDELETMLEPGAKFETAAATFRPWKNQSSWLGISASSSPASDKKARLAFSALRKPRPGFLRATTYSRAIRSRS